MSKINLEKESSLIESFVLGIFVGVSIMFIGMFGVMTVAFFL